MKIRKLERELVVPCNSAHARGTCRILRGTVLKETEDGTFWVDEGDVRFDPGFEFRFNLDGPELVAEPHKVDRFEFLMEDSPKINRKSRPPG